MIVTFMKQLFSRTSKLANYIVMMVLVLVPFHAFLTVWGSKFVGHYTLLRLWDDAALLLLLGIATIWLVKDEEIREWFAGSLLVRLIVGYAGLSLLLSLVSLAKGDVAPKALAYGLLINLRFLGWFLVVLLTAQRSPLLARLWPKLVLVPAAVVVLFAGLQSTALPHNFLAHFGYDKNATIAPVETINHNASYIRVQSTLRGANPLGAYLVLILSVLGTSFFWGKRKVVCGVFGVVALFALYASGSRSAWIGSVLSLLVVGWLQLKNHRQRIYFGGASLALLVVLVGGYLLLKSNTRVQNELLHTQTHSASKVSSNAAHASAFKNGINDVVHQPFGSGPGTAGPASQYNTGHPVRIAENYYVQIAQETGWIGLALFVGIVVLVAQELYGRIKESRLALALFAALIGISFVNLLSHAWTDDTLAYLWWGLAGIALGSVVPKQEEN